MLLLADVLEYAGERARRMRVIWLGPAGRAYVIDVDDDHAVPELVSQSTLKEDLREKRATLLSGSKLAIVVADATLTESRRAARDAAWEMIKTLVTDQPKIFTPSGRSSLVRECVGAGVSTRVTLYAHLRRFWQRGLTKNALLSDHPNCGAPGKERNSSLDIKRGRPRLYGDLPGLNITEDIRKTFQLSVDRYYASNPKFSKQGAYNAMLKDFFQCQRIDVDTGLLVHYNADAYKDSGVPSLDQYLYWLKRDFLAPVLKRKRMGAVAYDKDCRGLLGTATASEWGPGSRFQIDATIADVYLVSRMNRNRIVGRPVIYVVIDVFSRLITGIYIGLENASWRGAMMALANTAENKVDFCSRAGRKITEDLWPACHLPATLLGDGGEIESSLIDALARNFGITIETAAPYRADWKGVVERRFHLLQATYKPYVPGYIEVDFKARGGTDYRYDAVLDIHQFLRIIIECVLFFNNSHELKKYDRDRDVAADGVPAIPVDLWEWGVEHRSGALRRFAHQEVQFQLMPTGTASVTEHGILFKGSYYTSPRAVSGLWFDRARQSGRWKVPVSYDDRLMDQICLHEKAARYGFETATLTDRSRAHAGLSLSEIEQAARQLKHEQANRSVDRQLSVSDLIGNIDGIVQQATEMRGNAPKSSIHADAIRQNRAEEQRTERQHEAFRPGNDSTRDTSRTAEVVPIRGQQPNPKFENFGELSIAEMWDDKEPRP
jgi:hypothetical protein